MQFAVSFALTLNVEVRTARLVYGFPELIVSFWYTVASKFEGTLITWIMLLSSGLTKCIVL